MTSRLGHGLDAMHFLADHEIGGGFGTAFVEAAAAI